MMTPLQLQNWIVRCGERCVAACRTALMSRNEQSRAMARNAAAMYSGHAFIAAKRLAEATSR